MATQPDYAKLDLEEQLARVAKMRVETEKLIEENRLARPKMLADIEKAHVETEKLIEQARLARPHILADIEMMRAHTDKLLQETRIVTPQVIFQGAIAFAALLGAGAALAKLFFPG